MARPTTPRDDAARRDDDPTSRPTAGRAPGCLAITPPRLTVDVSLHQLSAGNKAAEELHRRLLWNLLPLVQAERLTRPSSPTTSTRPSPPMFRLCSVRSRKTTEDNH